MFSLIILKRCFVTMVPAILGWSLFGNLANALTPTKRELLPPRISTVGLIGDLVGGTVGSVLDGSADGIIHLGEEVTGIADQRRASEAMAEARRAFDDIQAMKSELANLQVALESRKKDFEILRKEELDFKVKFRQQMAPILAQASLIDDQNRVFGDIHRSLRAESANMYSYVSSFREGSRKFLEARSFGNRSIFSENLQVDLAVLLEVMKEEIVMRRLPMDLVKSVKTSAKILGSQGGLQLQLLNQSYATALEVYQNYLSTVLPEKSAGIRDGLTILSGEMVEMQKATASIVRKAAELNATVIQR